VTKDYIKQIEELQDKIEQLKVQMERDNAKKQGRWKPIQGEEYYFVDSAGDAHPATWQNFHASNHRLSIGNCYPATEEGRELAIWEQVIRRRYDQQLRDAADWVGDDGWYIGALQDGRLQTICPLYRNRNSSITGQPRFNTAGSCVEAHERILGKDAKRYFTGEK
jgi:hypothetical protein